MNRIGIGFRVVSSCLVVAAACGEDGLFALKDRPDAGGTGTSDAGARVDAGATVDAGEVAEVDAGPVEEVDAGPVEEVDAGPVEEVDAGPTEEVDAGEPVDAGSDPVDAGPGPSGDPNPCGPPQIAPKVPGELSGGFQSVVGTGYQQTITVTLPCPARFAKAEIIDPDYPDNLMIAYAGTNEVGRVRFIGDNLPGTLTRDTQVIEAEGITKIELVPDPRDYVAYELVVYYEQ